MLEGQPNHGWQLCFPLLISCCWGSDLRFYDASDLHSEHYRQTKKPRKVDNFLYRHFKKTNHSTSSISIQPVEKIIYGDNSTKRYKNILRNELELKLIKLLQTPHPLGFNDNIYHEGNISRLPDFDVSFSFRYP